MSRLDKLVFLHSQHENVTVALDIRVIMILGSALCVGSIMCSRGAVFIVLITKLYHQDILQGLKLVCCCFRTLLLLLLLLQVLQLCLKPSRAPVRHFLHFRPGARRAAAITYAKPERRESGRVGARTWSGSESESESESAPLNVGVHVLVQRRGPRRVKHVSFAVCASN